MHKPNSTAIFSRTYLNVEMIVTAKKCSFTKSRTEKETVSVQNSKS